MVYNLLEILMEVVALNVVALKLVALRCRTAVNSGSAVQLCEPAPGERAWTLVFSGLTSYSLLSQFKPMHDAVRSNCCD